MSMIKKSIAVLLIVALTMGLAGCSSSKKDTVAPVIELVADEVVYNGEDTYDPMSYVVSATDDSEETIDVQFDDSGVDLTTPGDYTITYTAADSSGNSSEKQLHIIVEETEVNSISFDLPVVYEDDMVKIELAQFYKESVWWYGSTEPIEEKHVVFKTTNKGNKEFLFNLYTAYVNDEAVEISMYSNTNSGPKPGKSAQYDYGIKYDTKPNPTPLESLDELYGLEGTFELAIKDGNYISGHKKIDFSLKDMDLD